MKNLLCVLLLSLSCFATTTTLTGTITDAQGNGVNGMLYMSLPVPAQDQTTNVAVSPMATVFRLVNGAVTGGAPLYDVATLQPQNLYYRARAYDMTGNLVFYGNFVVTGASFDIGSAVPTSITTSNVWYISPVSLSGNNTWTGSNTFSLGLSASGTVNLAAATVNVAEQPSGDNSPAAASTSFVKQELGLLGFSLYGHGTSATFNLGANSSTSVTVPLNATFPDTSFTPVCNLTVGGTQAAISSAVPLTTASVTVVANNNSAATYNNQTVHCIALE